MEEKSLQLRIMDGASRKYLSLGARSQWSFPASLGGLLRHGGGCLVAGGVGKEGIDRSRTRELREGGPVAGSFRLGFAHYWTTQLTSPPSASCCYPSDVTFTRPDSFLLHSAS